MHILDVKQDRVVQDVTLFLTESEAKHLHRTLERLLAEPRSSHDHVLADDCESAQITVTIVRPGQEHTYDERSRRLLTLNE